MMDVAIVEDERLAARELVKMLNALRPNGVRVVAHLENVAQAAEWLAGNRPDLIFMDIHLGDGNSFGIFEKVEVNTPIIFTTAYDQYALQAFKQCSIDYLLKPIDADDLEVALSKFENLYKGKSSIDFNSLQQSLDSILGGNRYQERFMVTCGDRIRSIEIDEVAYFMADGKSLFLFGKDGNRYLFEGTLSSLEERLDPKRFFRINRKFFVSYQSIEDMVYYSKTRIKVNLLPNHPETMDAIVSQDRCNEFKRWLNQ